MKYNAPYGSTDPDASYFDRDTPSLQRGSVPPAAAIEQPQREIVDVIKKAELTPDNTLQLWPALQRMGLNAGSRARRWMAVISKTISSAPGAPTEGDAYLIPAGATGIWAANVGKIAEWTGSSWSYISPTDGHGIALPDGRIFVRIAGSYVELKATDTVSGVLTLNDVRAAAAAGALKASTRAIWSGAASISSGVISVVPLGSFTDDGQADWVLTGGELVCQRAGRYLVFGGFAMTGGGPYSTFSMGIDLNTVNMLSSTVGLTGSPIIESQAAGSSQIRDFVVGNKLRASLYQVSGGSKTTQTTIIVSTFRLSPL